MTHKDKAINELLAAAKFAVEQMQRVYHGEEGGDIGAAITPLLEAIAKAEGK